VHNKAVWAASLSRSCDTALAPIDKDASVLEGQLRSVTIAGRARSAVMAVELVKFGQTNGCADPGDLHGCHRA
jgi:hypothetical protein